MITKSSNATLKQSQSFTSYTFGIKESGLSHIFNVLRNQLYSDKVLAVIREYSCNAVDAHTEVGKKDTPIKVTLPNPLMLDFKVRDFGRGLTEKEIGEVYAMYGESTKRGTNEQIGQLGLGSKSAFAYGDNFVINSFVKGTKTSYNAFIDPSNVGQISKLSEETTDEPDGIEIVIAVKRDDCDEFYRKAVDLFAYFEVKPQVEGVDVEKFSEESGKGGVLVEGDSWKVFRKGESVAVMGNIGYPLDSYALGIHQTYGSSKNDVDTLRYAILNSSILLKFNIGDLDISASREALQYTDATKAAIISKIDEVIKDIPARVGEKFNQCKTLWEAKCFWQETFAYGGVGYSLSEVVSKNGVIWNGKKVTSGTFDFAKSDFKIASHAGSDSDVTLLHFVKPNSYGRRKRIRGEYVNKIMAEPNVLVIEDDRPSPNGRLNRIAPLLENYEGRNANDKLYDGVYLINFNNPAKRQTVLDKTGLDIDLIKLNSLPNVKLRDIYPSNSTGKTNPAVKSTKHTVKEFSFDQDHSGSAYDNCRSDWFTEESVDVKNDEGIYLKVDKFYICSKGSDEGTVHPHKIQKHIELLKKLDIDVPTIYSFKRGRCTSDGLDRWDDIENSDNWTCYFEWLKDTVKDLVSDDSIAQTYIDRKIARVFSDRSTSITDSLNCCGSNSDTDKSNRDFNIAENIHNEDSLFLSWYKKFDEMYYCEDAEKIDTLIHVVDTLGMNEGLFKEETEEETGRRFYTQSQKKINYGESKVCGKKPSYNLCKIMSQVSKRYPFIKRIDDDNFGYQWRKDFATDFFNYINMVDTTYNFNKSQKIQ